MKKRILAMLTATMMVLGLAACGATDDNDLVFHRYKIYSSILFLINSTNSRSLTGVTEANFPFPYSIKT